jgi:hypothetical protein
MRIRRSRFTRTGTATAGVATLLGSVLAMATAGAAPDAGRGPVVRSVQQISAQDVPTQPGSEADTLTEPDIAVSPRDPRVAVAAAHDSRFPDGGAAAISHAWTRDGGRTWEHAPVRFLTKITGGDWDRVSDPVLAFDGGGDVYLSTIALNDAADDCRSVVLVSRSTDGGATFGRPSAARLTDDCDVFNDKNWLIVDNSARSPHRGRVYQFWTLFDASGASQVVNWSDDHGRTWSPVSAITKPSAAGSQNSQPAVLDDGTVVDTYLDFTLAGRSAENEEGEKGDRTAGPRAGADRAAAADPNLRILARRSKDGGATWSAASVVAQQVGGGPDGVRCCLPSATVDASTGQLYSAWTSEDSSQVLVSSSGTGRTWTAPRRVSHGTRAGLQRVNVDVTADRGVLTATYATRDSKVAGGRYWQQQVSTSRDGGHTFGPALAIGPRYDSKYAAVARGIFPGDYIGSASAAGRVYLTWALAGPPPTRGATYHQVLYGATITP